MLLKKKVRAGVLLYALLMSAIFALLLQFYLGRVQAAERQNHVQLSAAKAYLIAQLTVDDADEKSGALTFNQGRSTWKRRGEKLTISVTLPDGYVYQYDFVKTEDERRRKSEESATKDISIEESSASEHKSE
ncbi:competence type IV pilus minor pilin ComGG [Streptococcus hillyeri]|uniref:Late competence protein ComGG n=1 Tax=Streptococcus hillyeri TaxID=2282420 RepID=A0A3L9DWA1_9STRE|nr:hypothetical protein EAF07_05835 [Streptococcus hillyeri]